MKIAITTRGAFDPMFNMTQELLGNMPANRITGVGAIEYLHHCISVDADWVINVDEDAFVFDFNAILALVDYMDKNGYDYAGPPDGGMPIRGNNPILMNAYFNVFHAKHIREKFNINIYNDAPWTLPPNAIDLVPKHMLRTKYDIICCTSEPYYPFFIWLVKNYKPLYLDSYQWAGEPLSTVLLNHVAKPMLFHTWYARRFSSNNWHQKRILKSFEYAKKLKSQEQKEIIEEFKGAWTEDLWIKGDIQDHQCSHMF